MVELLCAVDPNANPEWLDRARLDCYQPLRQRGLDTDMGFVFDLGMLLFQPAAPRTHCPAGLNSEQAQELAERKSFLDKLSANNWVPLARSIWENASRSAKPLVGRLLVEALAVPLAGRKLAEVQAADIPDRVRLFLAYTASQSPYELEDFIDYETLDACLSGPKLRPGLHDPPPVVRTEDETRTTWKQPGILAGYTSINTKTDRDSIMDVVPFELCLLLVDYRAGLQRLMERPMVYVRERDQDLLPKHRALVCFVVGTGRQWEGNKGKGSGEARYRQAAVFAKRQIFDLVCDLRQAVYWLESQITISVDVAVFVMEQGETAVKQFFELTSLKVEETSDPRLDRFLLLKQFAGVVPGFLHRPGWRRRRDWFAPLIPGAHEIAEPDLDRFLKRQAHRPDPYHAIHVVPIGSERELPALFPTLLASHRLATTRQQIMMIAVNDNAHDPDGRLKGEPAWQMKAARTHAEAMRLLSEDLPVRPLAQLRRQFVEMVLGATRSLSISRRR